MKLIRDIGFILIVSTVIGLCVNAISPVGIALVGEWNPEKGVVTAGIRNRTIDRGIEVSTVEHAYALYKDKSVVFVDARDELSYNSGHISGATHLFVHDYNSSFPFFVSKIPFETPIVVYCSGRNCEDAHTLAEYLKEDGYTDVLVFADGYSAWEKEGLPVERKN